MHIIMGEGPGGYIYMYAFVKYLVVSFCKQSNVTSKQLKSIGDFIYYHYPICLI